MIWDLETVENMRGLHYDEAVLEDVLSRATFDVEGYMLRMLRETFIREADERFGVEPNESDVVITKEDDGRWNSILFRTRWHPRTKRVELNGGPFDGFTVESGTKVGDIIRIGGPTSHFLRSNAATYRFGGWNNSTRRWVYSVVADS